MRGLLRAHPERPLLGAALFWLLFTLRWFDVGRSRPAWLQSLPPWLLLLPALSLAGAWLARRRRDLLGPTPAAASVLWLPVAASVLFRLPFVAQAAAAAVTSDGALSGIVMLRVLAGGEHFVFIPNVPYSGSLKSHFAAALSLALDLDPPRAFALSSVLFYAFFVAGLVRLAALLPGAGRFSILGAGLYAAFAPPFVTRYSLSNDGNYVEVLALGTWALFLAVRFAQGGPSRPLALAIGLALGLGFWCHILAVIPLAAVAALLVLAKGAETLRAAPVLAAAWGLGNAPGLLWNLANGGESFRYLLPGGPAVGGEAPGPAPFAHFLNLLTDHLPTLFGRDPGYGRTLDGALLVLGGVGALLFAYAAARAGRRVARDGDAAPGALLLFVAVNLGVAVLALPYIPGNARYLLFTFGPASVLMAFAFGEGRWSRFAFSLLVGGSALASSASLPGAARADARWRGFVRDLESAGVRFCTTDFYLATKINFLSSERVVCSARLGPTTTEYFSDYEQRVERADRAALVAVNATAASRLEDRLRALAVPFVRYDFMKPVLVPDRNVDPRELFPHRAFPVR